MFGRKAGTGRKVDLTHASLFELGSQDFTRMRRIFNEVSLECFMCRQLGVVVGEASRLSAHAATPLLAARPQQWTSWIIRRSTASMACMSPSLLGSSTGPLGK